MAKFNHEFDGQQFGPFRVEDAVVVDEYGNRFFFVPNDCTSLEQLETLVDEYLSTEGAGD
jgi:hypothetical protein